MKLVLRGHSWLEMEQFAFFCYTGLFTQVYSYTEQPEFALNQAAFEVQKLFTYLYMGESPLTLYFNVLLQRDSWGSLV